MADKRRDGDMTINMTMPARGKARFTGTYVKGGEVAYFDGTVDKNGNPDAINIKGIQSMHCGPGEEFVDGYVKEDGTVVAGYCRRKEDRPRRSDGKSERRR